MRKFFAQIFKKIEKLDNYTNQYLMCSNNVEIPSLAYTNWAMHFANLKDFGTAIDKLETAILMSSNPKPCISLGIIYAKLKEYEKAEMTLKKALERDSQNAYTYSVLSSVLVAQDKFDEAEDSLKKALKLAPSDAEIYLNYGILYAKLQKKNKAVEMLKKSKFLNPTNTHVYFLLGIMLFETDKINEAFIEFKQLEDFNPKYRNLSYYLALCYKKEKNYMAVLEYAQRALEESPENPAIYILLAQNYMSLEKERECYNLFQQAENKGVADVELYLAWGITLLNNNKISEAKEKIEKVLELDANNANALYRLGSCYYKEKNYEKAESLFKQAIFEDPTNTLAISDLGILYYDTTRYEEAINTLFKAISISSQKSYLYFYIANCYYKLGRQKKSLEYYEKTIEYYPNHLEALINYTVNLIDMDNIREALRKIRNAYQINRESDKVLLVYALTSLKAGIYSDAIEKADQLLTKTPDSKDAMLIKANALINIRKPQEALNILLSQNDEDKNNYAFAYLAYCAYKILVEESPSNYNESMVNFYLEKINELKDKDFDKNQISPYISKALNINKG